MKRLRMPQFELPPDPTRKSPCSPEDYKKLDYVGHGSYGTVTKATHRTTGETVAIKTHKNIDSYAGDQIRYRFMNELLMLSSQALLGKAKSEHIIKMRDWYFAENGQIHIALDYCPIDMHRMMNKFALTEKDMQFYAAEIVLGLEAIHNAQIVHNDLKPENVLLDQSGHVKITDFGISELCRQGEKKRGQYGTQIYMSPETINFRGYDHTSDYFSLGVMLYEMMSGELPFVGKTTADISQQQKKKIHFRDSISANAQSLIKGLLQRNVSKRREFIQNIKNHPFFDGVNWETISNQEPPYNPSKNQWNTESTEVNQTPILQRKRSCSKSAFCKLAIVFKNAKKSKKLENKSKSEDKSALPGKSLTEKMQRKNPLASRLLYRSLNRFSVSSTRSTDSLKR